MRRLLARRRQNEGGAIALLIALFLTVLLIATAMVLDFGLARVDRQVNKSSADSAAMAGAYALNGDSEVAYPFRGVCTAVRYLKVNDARFATMTPDTGDWTDASATPASFEDGCASELMDEQCIPSDPSSWARFTWTGDYQGEPVAVTIQSGYSLTSAEGSAWREESLPAVLADNEDEAGGCFQLAVIVSQERDPGFGSLATQADLRTAVRSVTRVAPVPGGNAPAMLLLRQTGCPVLGTGGSGGGSFIHVLGAESDDGKTQPGTIHADASGASCTGGSTKNIFWGRDVGGIVAYAAPGSGEPGEISSTAVFNNFSSSSGVVRDADANVYAATGVDADNPGDPLAIQPRGPVTRKPVDDRYLGSVSDSSGVRGIVAAAQANIFGRTASQLEAVGFRVTDACDSQKEIAEVPTVPPPDEPRLLYVDCPGAALKAIGSLTGWETIVFNGSLDPTSEISAPDANKVYVFGGTGSAINIQNDSSAFSMNTADTLATSGDIVGNCVTDPLLGEQGLLVVRDGNIVQNGGMLRLCNTTVVMMSGEDDACLPANPGEPPKPLPCGGTIGTGQIDKNGGAIDWTAPNQQEIMTLPDGSPDPAKAPLWTSLDGPEDLAFWSESSSSSSVKFRMTGGGGTLNVQGVYMIPNADPFEIGGNASQDLTDAQYIASSIQLNGNGTDITMSVDPNAAVTIPKLGVIGLVR